MGSATGSFCLKWNDFQMNIASSYQDLHISNDFSDVTLVCEEDQHIEAHRVILSASSPVFKTILKKNNHTHPMIYMRGLKSKNLVAIIEFIYNGEVNIIKDYIDSFLSLAEELQLKGLTANLPEEPVKSIPLEIETNKIKKIKTVHLKKCKN